MEEIWYSLPSLRKVLEFEDGWDSAKTFAWQRLNTAASSMCLCLLLELKGIDKVTQTNINTVFYLLYLFLFFVASEMLQFPISVLTTSEIGRAHV